MVGRWMGVLVLAVSGLVSSPAFATHDYGGSYSVVRFAANGRHVLLVECDMSGGEGSLLVVSSSGKVKKKVALEKIGLSAEEEAGPCFASDKDFSLYMDSAAAVPELKKIRTKYGFTVQAKATDLSPDSTRFLLVGERNGKGMVTLLEGKKAKKLGSYKLDGSGDSPIHQGVSVAWSPDGKMAVASGSYLSSVDEGSYEWTPFYLVRTFSGPAQAKLSKRLVAEQLNAQGYRYYKKDQEWDMQMHDPGKWYARAVKWDPTYETAIGTDRIRPLSLYSSGVKSDVSGVI